MHAKWKRVFLWSSVGGLTLGTVAAAIIGARKRSQTRTLQFRKMPSGCSRVTLWTQRFRHSEQGTDYSARDTYILETTPFKLWSVLELPDRSGGSTIYHITLRRSLDPVEPALPGKEVTLDRFYAAVAVEDPDGRQRAQNVVARGGILILSKCLVGGAANGIETGEVHRSAAPILNFRFESFPGADAGVRRETLEEGQPAQPASP
ncbi:MAG: hypothetical protein HXY20_01155 [Acidobacteria bacterium]|nr:hypothetical protein [Acidobacteriota bacterium]